MAVLVVVANAGALAPPRPRQPCPRRHGLDGGCPSRNLLFHNEGNGRFTNVSAPSGIGKPTSCYAFSVVASDFDGDGYPDLYVACDSTRA